MFKRVIYEAWADWVPFVAFAITAIVFVSFVIRAVTLRKEFADSMARLPLEDDTNHAS